MIDFATAMRMGRPDLARSTAGRGATLRSGPGAVYTAGKGTTAAGLSAETRIGPASGSFSLDTGTVSALELAAVVVGLMAFYWWTRGHQA